VVVAVAVAGLLLELHHVRLLRGVQVQLLEDVLRVQQLRVDLLRREVSAGARAIQASAVLNLVQEGFEFKTLM